MGLNSNLKNALRNGHFWIWLFIWFSGITRVCLGFRPYPSDRYSGSFLLDELRFQVLHWHGGGAFAYIGGAIFFAWILGDPVMAGLVIYFDWSAIIFCTASAIVLTAGWSVVPDPMHISHPNIPFGPGDIKDRIRFPWRTLADWTIVVLASLDLIVYLKQLKSETIISDG